MISVNFYPFGYVCDCEGFLASSSQSQHCSTYVHSVSDKPTKWINVQKNAAIECFIMLAFVGLVYALCYVLCGTDFLMTWALNPCGGRAGLKKLMLATQTRKRKRLTKAIPPLVLTIYSTTILTIINYYYLINYY